jgi:acetylornithine deacetylase/succinyl-diaminopimelate desuccinylase-like protein
MHEVISNYVGENKDRFISELQDFLRIPSVSADPEFSEDVFDAAEFVREKLVNAGAENVEIIPTEGYPVVYGEKTIDPALPTVLVYGHYDVQPADPYELWNTAPFDPQIRDGKIYARGASDDKGQVYMHIKAFESMMHTNNLSCNIKFMIEGEEEVGSANLGKFIKDNKERLKSDVILISDTSMIAPGEPSIDIGLRGLAYLEVEVTGPNRDLHSGTYGGAVGNPINILCKMIASLTDENNHITIPGFYDKVREYSDEERKEFAKIPFSEEAYKDSLDIDDIYGERGFSTYERTSIRPTLDVNGMWGGYIGEGSKTVLPSKAYAKISMRLVPDQNWDEITKLFTDHFTKIAPKAVKVKVKPHHGGNPVLMETDSFEFNAASDAYEESFGKKPLATHSGGSIPIVALFEKELQVKALLMGFGLDSDNIHSPNEHFHIENYLKGIETVPLFFRNYSEKS